MLLKPGKCMPMKHCMVPKVKKKKTVLGRLLYLNKTEMSVSLLVVKHKYHFLKCVQSGEVESSYFLQN